MGRMAGAQSAAAGNHHRSGCGGVGGDGAANRAAAGNADPSSYAHADSALAHAIRASRGFLSHAPGWSHRDATASAFAHTAYADPKPIAEPDANAHATGKGPTHARGGRGSGDRHPGGRNGLGGDRI